MAFDYPAFFQHKAPIGPRQQQFVVQRSLGALIGFRDKIGGAFAADLQMLNLADFVSKADQRAERTLYDELLLARPDWGFVLEEGGVIEGNPDSPRSEEHTSELQSL